MNSSCIHSGGKCSRINAARRRERAIVSGYSFRSFSGGIPLAMISEFLGHAQIETTRIYAHADTEMKRKAIQQATNLANVTIPDAIWNIHDEEMMKILRGK